MSRKNEQVGGMDERKMESGRLQGGQNGETGLAQTVVSVEPEENPNEAERRSLLNAENDRESGVQEISATCQSITSHGSEHQESRLSSSSSLGKGLVHIDAQHCKDEPFNEPLFYEYGSVKRKSSVPNAFLTLILALFNLSWSVGLTYWHFQLNNFGVAVTSLVIIALSGSITSIAFFTGQTRKRNKSSSTGSPTTEGCSAQRELWRCSKLAWLLAAVPCLVPLLLGSTYFISSVLEKGAQWSGSNSSSGGSCGGGSTTAIASKPASGGNKGRQCAKSNAARTTGSSRWLAASGCFFLLESLTLCFPICVLHLSVLMEDSNSIPSVIGLYTLLGLFILSFSITFSRFQFDCLNKPDRFGDGTEKYLRFTYLWSAKIIWLVTFAILIVTVRLVYPGREMEATAAAVAGLTAIHEIPLWMCLLPQCGKLAAKLSGLFFLIPQFTALISLIYWVNTDPLIYNTNIGSLVLGLYFWSEAVMLCGWLVDGNADKDVDLVPLYPHFFGDLISSCFTEETAP